MKRTIVCTLLALSISSSLYSPQIVLAAEQTEETLTEHSNTGTTDAIQNTKSATAPKEDTITKTEEQAPVSITVNENLDVLKQKLKNPFKEEVSSGRYLLTEDLIFIGYLDSSRGEEGFSFQVSIKQRIRYLTFPLENTILMEYLRGGT